MKKINYLVTILFLISILTACSVDTANIEDNPKLEDLNYFCDTLEKNHKNLYANISKNEFEIEKQRIAEKTPEMSDSDFYYSLKYLLSMVGDAHTTVNFTDSQHKHLNSLGFAVKKYSDGWYLMMMEKENEQYLGWRLLAINDMDISDIFTRTKKIMSYENETWAEKNFSNTINFKDALEYLGIIEKGEPIVFKIEDRNGDNTSLEIKSIKEKEDTDVKIASVTPENSPKTLIPAFYSAIPLDENCFFIQYNVCQESPELSMKEFVSNVSDEIKGNNYKKVIIDLRYNSGGNSNIFGRMLMELAKLQRKDNFKVYTIIGENTFSSAMINAIQIKEMLNSKLVGTPTGGNVNSYGEVRYFNLKNYPITVSYSTKYFELIEGYEKDSLYPDIYVEQNFENYLNGVDQEVEMILEIED